MKSAFEKYFPEGESRRTTNSAYPFGILFTLTPNDKKEASFQTLPDSIKFYEPFTYKLIKAVLLLFLALVMGFFFVITIHKANYDVEKILSLSLSLFITISCIAGVNSILYGERANRKLIVNEIGINFNDSIFVKWEEISEFAIKKLGLRGTSRFYLLYTNLEGEISDFEVTSFSAESKFRESDFFESNYTTLLKVLWLYKKKAGSNIIT